MANHRGRSTAQGHIIHRGQVTHICVGNLTIIGPDNGLSSGRRQAIIWTNAGILLIGPRGTNFSEILIGIQTFSFKKMHLKMSSAKWRPFCLGLNVLRKCIRTPSCPHPDMSMVWGLQYFALKLALNILQCPRDPHKRPVELRIVIHVSLFIILFLGQWSKPESSGSALARVMACCLTAPSHYLNQC